MCVTSFLLKKNTKYFNYKSALHTSAPYLVGSMCSSLKWMTLRWHLSFSNPTTLFLQRRQFCSSRGCSCLTCRRQKWSKNSPLVIWWWQNRHLILALASRPTFCSLAINALMSCCFFTCLMKKPYLAHDLPQLSHRNSFSSRSARSSRLPNLIAPDVLGVGVASPSPPGWLFVGAAVWLRFLFFLGSWPGTKSV